MLAQYPTDPFRRHTFFSKKRNTKKITRKLKRQFENAMLDRIENLSDKNPKQFWKLVNSIKLHQASTKTNEIQASEWYFENFNGITSQTDKDNHETQIFKDYNRWAISKHDTFGRLITPQEICTQSNKMKNKKAAANDFLSNEIIQLAVKTLPSYFTSLFNAILSQGKFVFDGLKVLLYQYINLVTLVTRIIIEGFVSAVY